jgi:hypothetical protein
MLTCRYFPVPAELIALARPQLDTRRDPQTDYDPIALWKRDQDEAHRLGMGPRLLPERIVSDEVAAQRRERMAELKAETIRKMQIANEDHRANTRNRAARRRLMRDGWIEDQK